MSANGSKAFRLTELFVAHDLQMNLKGAFEHFLQSKGYEYIDFVEFGFDDEILSSFGFRRCRSDLYVPHLFEPFVSERREVLIAYKSEDRFFCTKGDSDLDRPNSRMRHE